MRDPLECCLNLLRQLGIASRSTVYCLRSKRIGSSQQSQRSEPARRSSRCPLECLTLIVGDGVATGIPSARSPLRIQRDRIQRILSTASPPRLGGT